MWAQASRVLATTPRPLANLQKKLLSLSAPVVPPPGALRVKPPADVLRTGKSYSGFGFAGRVWTVCVCVWNSVTKSIC